MKVALYFTRWVSPPFGGWFSYTVHTALALRAAGIECDVICLRKRRDKTFDLGFGVDVEFLDPAADETVDRLKTYDVLHGAFVAFEKDNPNSIDAVIAAERPGVITIHDPTEVKPKDKLLRLLVGGKIPGLKKLVAIRPVMKTLLAGNTGGRYRVSYIPHPYAFQSPVTEAEEKQNVAVATSRVDFDKNTHLLLQAKPAVCEIEYWTGGVNRIYAYHKLRQHGWPVPGYKGKFGRDPLDLLNVYGRAKALIDMSSISGDGGGTQYTFLEAIDHECVMVLNSAWAKRNDKHDVLRPGVDYIACTTPEDIAFQLDLVCKNEDYRQTFVQNARAQVHHHDAASVGVQYRELYLSLS